MIPDTCESASKTLRPKKNGLRRSETAQTAFCSAWITAKESGSGEISPLCYLGSAVMANTMTKSATVSMTPTTMI